MRVLVFFLLIVFMSCQKQEAQTDNIPQPIATCSDGIMNQGEEDIDCGGPCPVCQATISAMFDTDTFNANFNTITSKYANNSFFMSGASSLGSLTLIYTGPLTIGTVNAQGSLVKSANSTTYISTAAVLNFEAINSADSTASGSFSFNAVNFSAPSDTVKVTNGRFKRISIKNN